MNQRIHHIKDVLSTQPYTWLLFPFSLLYAIFSFGTVVYIHGSLEVFYRSMYPSYTIPFTLLTVIITLLMGVAITLFVAKIKELRAKGAGLSIGGIFLGSLAAGCPGCFFGLFPFVLSFFGISATLAILPFNGLELQALAIPILVWSIWELGKEMVVVCTIATKK